MVTSQFCVLIQNEIVWLKWQEPTAAERKSMLLYINFNINKKKNPKQVIILHLLLMCVNVFT